MNTYSTSLDALAGALAEAQAEFGAVPKDSSNPFYKNRYSSLASVVASATPVLTKHGLSVSQFLGFDGEHDTLTTWLLHKSGQYIVQSMRLHLTKQDAQGHGSSATYAKRYSYMAVLGLVSDDDDDGNAASRKPAKPPTASRPATPSGLSLDAVVQLKEAAHGLSPDQVKMAFAAAGVEAGAWSAVPAAKAADLVKLLLKQKRAA